MKYSMTLPSLFDTINQSLSLANAMLLIGCHFDAVNSEMTVGDVGEASGVRSRILMWDPAAALAEEVP